MKTLRIVLRGLGILLILAILLPYLAKPGSFAAVLKTIPFGWWHFLKRNIPQLTYDWGLAATALVCTAGLLFLGNWLMGALCRQFQTAAPSVSARRWKWSWSLAVYAAIWLLFVVAFGAAGVFRHATWLYRSTEPWHEERLNFYLELSIASGEVEQCIFESKHDLQKARETLASVGGHRRGERLLAEDFNIILFPGKSNKVAAYVIIPRNPKLLAKANFATGTPTGSHEVLPLSELEPTIAKWESAHAATNRQ